MKKVNLFLVLTAMIPKSNNSASVAQHGEERL
jgi:hypothetical protein